MRVPNPGSDAAREQGCLCPILDNEYGRGFPGPGGLPQFWIVGGCPLHDPKDAGAEQKEDSEMLTDQTKTPITWTALTVDARGMPWRYVLYLSLVHLFAPVLVPVLLFVSRILNKKIDLDVCRQWV